MAKLSTLKRYASDANKQRQAEYKRKYGTTHPRLQSREYTCKVCGGKYHPFSSLSKYCSRECMHKDNPKKQIKVCPICNKEFETHKGISQRKFCSSKCYYKSIKKKTKICPICGKTFLKNNRKYCSRKCGYVGITGKPLRKDIKRHKLDEVWSKVIKKIAGNKCEYCENIKRLNSHHIFSRNNYSVRWLVENGVCLCVKHHRFGTMSAHTAPIEFVEWLKEKRGEKWYEDLRVKAKNTGKINVERKKQIYKELKEKLIA